MLNLSSSLRPPRLLPAARRIGIECAQIFYHLGIGKTVAPALIEPGDFMPHYRIHRQGAAYTYELIQHFAGALVGLLPPLSERSHQVRWIDFSHVNFQKLLLPIAFKQFFGRAAIPDARKTTVSAVLDRHGRRIGIVSAGKAQLQPLDKRAWRERESHPDFGRWTAGACVRVMRKSTAFIVKKLYRNRHAERNDQGGEVESFC